MNFKRILVALPSDSTSESPVFETALDLAIKNQGKLMLFHCLPQDTVAEMEDRVGSTSIELQQSDALQKLDARHKHTIEHMYAWLEGLSREHMDKGVEFRISVEIGRPNRTTVALAKSWQADLIVIGLTKRSALTDWLTSSMTSYLVHHAPCSVLLVHE